MSNVQDTEVDSNHRVQLTERHYDLVRRYMVENNLPNVRRAALRMIEVAAKGSSKRLLPVEDELC